MRSPSERLCSAAGKGFTAMMQQGACQIHEGRHADMVPRSKCLRLCKGKLNGCTGQALLHGPHLRAGKAGTHGILRRAHRSQAHH